MGGLNLPNPIGLAAGFDKNAENIDPLLRFGFGFIEVGAATPKPQEGNLKPRLFRLQQDDAIINRFGFNNQGMEFIRDRLQERTQAGVIGINLGANSSSIHKNLDYIYVLETCGPYVDFATINVSSPNTDRLREMQSYEALVGIIDGTTKTRDSFERKIPIFLKIAPDITDDKIEEIGRVARMSRIDGLILTNTTTNRDRSMLKSALKEQPGGLSGRPLFEKSNEIQRKFALSLQGEIPIIGVGGVFNAQDALTKIKLGASAIQLYTSLIYQGLSSVRKINRELDALLKAEGYETVSQAIGVDL